QGWRAAAAAGGFVLGSPEAERFQGANMLKTITLSGAAIVASLLLAASGPSARAQEPQVVVNCSFELEWCEALRVEFEATRGVKAAVVRKSAGETMAQIRAEGDNPRFDAWHSAGVDSAKIVADEGYLDS